ncbi:glycoside hydrolase family 13 protein [Levilactobacillus tongjiangensis]|uniref:Alpha-glucosidase n=1 Tax=Levilactobacillus tongjiangensis TaxID=2486023 RepID=A0ABW1SWL4_9LACO|nr:alpha-glucosidase [Levilactobacillus tongjiangensis]
MADAQWWQHAVGYQIYPQSFFDSNHDGVGDLPGIQTKIDYLRELGVDFVWLSSFYPSGDVDNGYDVTDYRAVAPQFGTINDFTRLVEAFHAADIKVVIDLALNHTSSQHPWFQAALTDVTSPYHDYYIWRDTQPGVAPNNWESVFGGSAWTYSAEAQAAYLHTFAEGQPDLNWENPAVRQEMGATIQWWADRGVDGFRLDGVMHLKKRQDFANVGRPRTGYTGDVAGTDAFLSALKPVLQRNNAFVIGEAGGIDMATAQRWLNPQTGYFDLLLEFDHVHFWEKAEPKLPVAALRETLSKWQLGLEGIGWNALFIENHDLPRAVSYYGNATDYQWRSAKALALWYFLMKGTPFIYQGQELGMANAAFTQASQYRDLDSRLFYQQQTAAGVPSSTVLQNLAMKSRDNARTPISWTHAQYGGFSDHAPWIDMGLGSGGLNVEQERHDPHGVLNFYQQLIRLKKSVPTLTTGRYELIDTQDDQLYVYRRTLNGDNWLVVVNMSNQIATTQEFDLNTSELILTNMAVDADSDEPQIQPWEARLYHLRKLE